MLDTNILLDWLLDRDPAHTKKIDALFARNTELHIPDIIIFEMVYVLEKFYKLHREVITANVHTILDTSQFNCNRSLFSQATASYLQHPSWSFVDACLVAYGRLQKVPAIWSFDAQLVSRATLVRSP